MDANSIPSHAIYHWRRIKLAFPAVGLSSVGIYPKEMDSVHENA